jgi:hypothetical protein
MESNQPPNECVRKSLSLKVKLPEREADHSPISSADGKNEWSYTATIVYVLMMYKGTNVSFISLNL